MYLVQIVVWVWNWGIEFVFYCVVFVGEFDVCDKCGVEYLLVFVYGLQGQVVCVENWFGWMLWCFIGGVVNIEGCGCGGN